MTEVPADDGMNEWRRRELLWTLRWLAAEPEATIKAAPNVCTADEIALDIDHWSEVATQWGLMTPETEAVVRSIDAAFTAMTERDDPALWTDDAIRRAPEWAELRARARVALTTMGAERADDALGSPREGAPVYVTGAGWPRSIWDRLSALRERLLK